MRTYGTVAGLAGMFALVCCLSPAWGREIPAVLTVEDAVRIAAERNPTLRAARNEVEMREADVVDKSQRLNPAFTVESENYPYFSSSAGPYFQSSEISARLDYEIETRGRRGLRTEVARRAAGVQEALYEDHTRELRLTVQQAFFQVVLAKANLALATSILAQTDEVIELNKVRFEQGEISELELRRIEVERLRFAEERFQGLLALRNAKSALLSLMDAPDMEAAFDVSGSLPAAGRPAEPGMPPEAPLPSLTELARDRRPDLAAAVEDQLRADTETRLQQALRSPNVTVGGGYKRAGPDNSLVFGVTVPLRVFNRNQGGMLRAAAEKRRAANHAAAVHNRIELEIRQAHNAVEVNSERVRYIEAEQLGKAEQARAVTLASYRLGGATLIDYLDAQRQYGDTVRIYNQALYDKRISLYQLANAIGVGGEK